MKLLRIFRTSVPALVCCAAMLSAGCEEDVRSRCWAKAALTGAAEGYADSYPDLPVSSHELQIISEVPVFLTDDIDRKCSSPEGVHRSGCNWYNSSIYLSKKFWRGTEWTQALRGELRSLLVHEYLHSFSHAGLRGTEGPYHGSHSWDITHANPKIWVDAFGFGQARAAEVEECGDKIGKDAG